ncbi:hypothetical protein Syun_014494 [Stephania yunnanensis]|uniref:Uncharacterized protein n=1 Tax=Stephania yunnanensis TaxID=152371 RepID=A0AAP0JJP8_9MAGN
MEHVVIDQVVVTVVEPGGSKRTKQLGNCHDHKDYSHCSLCTYGTLSVARVIGIRELQPDVRVRVSVKPARNQVKGSGGTHRKDLGSKVRFSPTGTSTHFVLSFLIKDVRLGNVLKESINTKQGKHGVILAKVFNFVDLFYDALLIYEDTAYDLYTKMVLVHYQRCMNLLGRTQRMDLRDLILSGGIKIRKRKIEWAVGDRGGDQESPRERSPYKAYTTYSRNVIGASCRLVYRLGVQGSCDIAFGLTMVPNHSELERFIIQARNIRKPRGGSTDLLVSITGPRPSAYRAD